MLKTLREARVGDFTLRLVQTKKGFSGVLFRDRTIAKQIDGDTADDVWRQLQLAAAENNPSYFGFPGARTRFLSIFADGFQTSAYVENEREYKVAAKRKLDSEAPLETACEQSGLGEVILAVFQQTNLLSPFEKVRIRDVLRGRHADAFVQGAAAFAVGDREAGFRRMVEALKPHDVAKWTALTYLPFLWRPDAHMYLKPEVTKDFAERVGHSFADKYSAQPRLETYDSLLDLAATTEREIAELKPRDRIDTQSFIWVVGEYTADDAAAIKAAGT